MSLADILTLPESPAHFADIESINEEAFGPGRFAKAAYKIREGGPHDASLSFVALADGEVVASCRLTPITAGEGRALLLGPLAVRPAHKNLGIGKHLVAVSIDAARKAGHGLVVLVGDTPYYGPLGFAKIPSGQLAMPRPVDQERLLACELIAGGLSRFRGMVMHADQAVV